MKYYTLQLPDGGTRKIFYDNSTDREAVVAEISREWESYCEKNWLTKNPDDRSSGEARVKRFMDSLTGFLFVKAEDDILSPYKDKRNRQREVMVPAGHDGFVDGLSAKTVDEIQNATPAFIAPREISRKQKPPVDTTFKRLERNKRKYPGLKVQVCAIDTGNVFHYNDLRYVISEKAEQYKGRKTSSGTRYDMDRVMVGTLPCGELRFFDQYGFELPQKYIAKVVDDKSGKTTCDEGEATPGSERR